jgi:glycosyltransferase involved in cell wall biosynthesis
MHDTSYNILLINHTWLKEELELIGHRVITAGCRGGFDIFFTWSCSIEELYEMLPEGFLPDRIVYYDDSADPSILNIEDALCPTVFLSVDIHHHYGWHKYFIESFSHTLIAQKDYIHKLETEQCTDRPVSWFPLWATQNIEPARVRDIPVSFRGTLSEKLHPARKTFFEYVSQKIPVDYAEGPFADVYARSRIVLNEAVNGDLNFRVFEGMIAGALMVTPRVRNGLQELFTDGEDLVVYDTGDPFDAIKKLEYYLSHDDERERIAENGRKKVLELHSRQARADKLSEILASLKSERIRLPVENKYFLLTHKLKVLWVYLRKYRYREIQNTINRLLLQVEAMVVNERIDENKSSLPIDDYLFSLDALNSDLLDEENYAYWITLLSDRYPNSELVRFLADCREKSDGKWKHPDKVIRLKESRSLVLNGYMKEM